MPERSVLLISYSHDSDAQRERVLGLSERLRQDGFEARIDQYVNGSPPEGWPRWMLDQIDAAEWVLVVCTETYYRRFRGHEEPGVGKGVTFEGLVITQELYDAHMRNTKFVPVLFEADDTEFVPEPLRPVTYYLLTSEQGYQGLLAALRRVAGIDAGPVGTPPVVTRPTAKPLQFDQAESGVAPPPKAPTPALAIWQQKRTFLLGELATASGEQKFAIQQGIEETDAMIARLEHDA